MKTIGLVIFDRWTQENAERLARQENLCLEYFEGIVNKEQPPCKIRVDSDLGSRITVYPDIGVTDDEKHRLLAWLVKMTGKKFTRFIRENEDTVSWICSGDEINLKDGENTFTAFIMMERASLGRCRIVKREKTVTVSELVCDGEVLKK